MGKINDGIFGAFTGRVGNLVGYSWRGMDLIRKRPKRRSKDSATVPQMEQRKKFALGVKFLTPVSEVVSNYFGRPIKYKSRFNQGLSYNVKNAIIPIIGGGYVMDYPRVILSKGDLRGIENGIAAPLAGQIVDFRWDDNSGQGSATANDKVVVVLYCPEEDLFQIYNPLGERADQNVTVTLPAFFAGKDMHVWGCLVSDSEKAASISTYLGSITIL